MQRSCIGGRSVINDWFDGAEQWLSWNRKVLDIPGPVLDIGCAGWNWSRPFIGLKRVVGVDPLATAICGVELRRAVVGPWSGSADLEVSAINPDASGLIVSPEQTNTVRYPMLAISDLINELRPAIVKINAEWAEYAILVSVAQPMAPHLAVSFHPTGEWGGGIDWVLIRWLEQWYESRPLSQEYGWWYFIEKDRANGDV